MRVSDLISLGLRCLVVAVIFAIIFGLLFLVGYHLIYKKWCKGTKTLTMPQFLLYALFVCYVVLVFGVTLLNRQAYHSELFRLTPFYSYIESWNQFKDADWRNIILNIFMLVPLGLLLPYLFKPFKKLGPTALAGLVFTLFIEVAQLLLHRGIFETDDLINNTLGTVIGYGFYRLADYIYKRIQKEPAKLKPVLLYQLPLVITVTAFITIFSVHNLQELGNLRCHHIIRAHPESVSCNAEFDAGPKSAYVYTVPIVSMEETREYALDFFAKYDSGIDESRTDIYDESAIYWNNDNSISLWIDYEGNKIRYTNFNASFSDSTVTPEENADEKELRESIAALGFFIPEEAVFTNMGDAQYTFASDCIPVGSSVYDGKVNCRYSAEGIILQLDYNLIKCTVYKEFPIISEEEAYTALPPESFATNQPLNRTTL